jgi:hypothetical protein
MNHRNARPVVKTQGPSPIPQAPCQLITAIFLCILKSFAILKKFRSGSRKTAIGSLCLKARDVVCCSLNRCVTKSAFTSRP